MSSCAGVCGDGVTGVCGGGYGGVADGDLTGTLSVEKLGDGFLVGEVEGVAIGMCVVDEFELRKAGHQPHARG